SLDSRAGSFPGSLQLPKKDGGRVACASALDPALLLPVKSGPLPSSGFHKGLIMTNGTSPHEKKLLWAGFFTIFASGVGFGVRAGILKDWAAQFGFTRTTLGVLTGGALWGFGVTIIPCSLFLARIGYKPLMFFAFFCHIASAAVTLLATPIHSKYGADA